MATVGQLTADKKALDPRTIVENEEAIDNITQAYVGLIIYNKENGKLYKVTEINSLSGKVVNSIVLPPSSIGAQPEINSNNKLSADNIVDGTTNKVVTQTDKTNWNGKQDALTPEQLANINKGGTALQPSSTSGLLKNDGTIDTETQSKAANAIQMPAGASADKVLGYENGAVAWVTKPSNGQDGAQGPQGPQGNTGSSVDYPYELVNNLSTDDATKGLTAAQGKVLDGKVSQLEAKVSEKYKVAYTSGKLAITKNREFSVSTNLVCKDGATSYTIPGGSSFTLTNISSHSAVLWAIIFDTANLRLIAKMWSATANGDVIICTVVADTATTISGVIHCVVPYTFGGKYFTAAQTEELVSAVGFSNYGQKFGVFYTQGTLEFVSSRSVKNTENLVCRIGTTSYTIPAGTVSDLSNIAESDSALWEIVFNIATLNLVAKRWTSAQQSDLVVATVSASGNTIGRIDHCVVPYTFDGDDFNLNVASLTKNRLVPVATQGFINCDNVNKKFIATKNIVIRFNNATYTVTAGTELQYNWIHGNTSLYKLCVDVSSSPLSFKIVEAAVDTKLPVLFTFYGTGNSTANNVLVRVVTSVITTKINGEDLTDRVTTLENGVSTVRDQTYQGEHILIDSNKFAKKAIPIASSLGQSFASYGDYLVTCNYSDSVATAKVMSLSRGTLLATLTLPYGSVNRPHCNVCCFGNEFGSADSIVPLLYVSQWDYEYERGVLVYDIKQINDVYSAELVQTIIPNNIGTEFLGAGSVDWVVDTDNSMIYALAYYLAGSSTIVEGNKEMVCKFALPKLADGSLVELTENDILDNWEMEMFNFSQDKCYNSGKIFVLSGYDTYPNWTKIRVIDLARKEIVSVIPLSQYGGEPEGMDIVSGFLSYGYSGANIYRLFF